MQINYLKGFADVQQWKKL